MPMDMLELQRLHRSRGILISFTGKLTQKLIVEYGEAVKTYLETNNQPQNEIFTIFSLFIEQTQNINNYCAVKADTVYFEAISYSSIVVIGKTDEGSYVCSGNLVVNEDVPALQSYVERVASLDKAELKAMYKSRLKVEVVEESAGAGLGILDMARKSKLPLEYSIVRYDETLSFFTLKATI